MKYLIATIEIALLLLVTSCSGSARVVSTPQQTIVTNDAGSYLCEYVKVTPKDGTAFYAGVCAPDSSTLSKAVETMRAIYPLVEPVADDTIDRLRALGERL